MLLVAIDVKTSRLYRLLWGFSEVEMLIVHTGQLSDYAMSRVLFN